jgi:hypothetical protein
MITITIFLFVGVAIFLPIFILTKNAAVEAVTITLGVTFYHFSMRLAVGGIVNGIMKNKANHENVWFREKGFERKLYKLIGVRKWKKYLPTYNPNTFDATQKTVQELVGATCQAEIVHEIIMLFSLLPIAVIPLLGGAIAMVVTSILAMLFDSLFVILQRYNRPKLIRIMGRFQRLKGMQ